ncbi:MAG: hypothetical protein H6595_05705 [Flavobacteriales bacterium]|nr:hypothetical protein [Flavobacteriales bacterium]MCB9166960.1 hypothetical protein [Flavobacteriales bacterium]
MQAVWFGIAHFMESTFSWFLTPFGWLPVYGFTLVFAFGAIYWLRLQERYSRKAKERGDSI